MKRAILFVFLIWTSPLAAINNLGNDLQFKQLDVEQGLPNRLITAIAEDSDQFIWIGSPRGLSRFDGHFLKTFKHSPENPQSISHDYVKALHLDSQSRLWVGTYGGGLNLFKDNTFKQINSKSNTPKNILSLSSTQDKLLIGTEDGLTLLDLSNYKFDKINLRVNSKNYSNAIYKVLVIPGGKVMVAGDNLIGRLDLKTSQVSDLSHLFPIDDRAFKTIHLGPNGKLWIGTHKALYSYNFQLNTLTPNPHPLLQTRIFDITSNRDDLYIGTFGNGFIRIDNKGVVSNFTKLKGAKNTLSDNIVYNIFLDSTNTLWAGTFNAGINYVNTNNLHLQKLTNNLPSFSCITNNAIYSLFKKSEDTYYVGTESDLFKINSKTQTCNRVSSHLDKLRISSINHFYNQLWIGTNQGLFTLDETKGYLETIINKNTIDAPINSSLAFSKKQMLLGTSKGLILFNKDTNQIQKICLISDNCEINIHQIKKLSSEDYIISSNQGLWTLSNKLTPQPFTKTKEFSNKVVNYVSVDNFVWVGLEQSNDIYQYSLDGSLLNTFTLTPDQGITLDVMSIIPREPSLIVSTDHGVFSLNLNTLKQKQYTLNDNMQSNSFIRNSAFKAPGGKLYFGGRNGFNAFYPEDIKDNLVSPKVALTKLTRFNEEVVPGEDYEGFSIDTPIEYLDELEIGHRDYVVGFEFAGLHFADPMRNQYQYKLEGFHEDWVSTDAKNRTATFTNLSPGDYVFRVKAANKDGIWSLEEDNVALKIRVHPAPWLSWWAFTMYGLVVMGSILWFIRYRTQSAIARAHELEAEVSVRTKEIATQKSVIESLLERKNELFANISHEFRTPLTLILGPLEKELKALDSPKNPKHLQMIQRNATRLLGMVEQILKLTELKKEDTVNKVPHAVNPALEAIVDSFGSLAESKQIELSLDLDKDANVMAAHDALEVMVGNLISNAIKYTPEGGKVSVTSKLLEQRIQISVTDTGVGMTPKQQEDIFERFVRLDKTSDIAGTGIGLSIVKELMLAHEGQIQVDSTESQGSTFTMSLPTTNQAALSDTHSIKAIEHLTQGEASTVTEPHKNSEVPPTELLDTQQELVLIIDDNHDMRDYIQVVLSPNYHCLTADRGEAGIELAKAHVPDLIICDIMMPGIDGYEVAKRLRDDIITSHIPLVLLTAKGDKESRIQGWNENIDDYMTKPFDEQELKARVSSIIDIRNILSRKAGQKLNLNQNNQSKTAPPIKPEIAEVKTKVLNKKEQAFIGKLMKIINENYQNSDFQRKDMAALMFISERQLQRKLRSLTGKNPTVLLREARLEKASKMLMEGESVTTAAMDCGYSSVSSFSKVFKAHQNISPKDFKDINLKNYDH